MRLEFNPKAFEDLQHWVQFQPKLAKRILPMIEETLRDPSGGIGKPEPLKNDFAGCWSKRIDDEHRLVYRVENQNLIIMQCRFHYKE
ncbi:MAG: Txe/YoeB family addiction module toxin [Verrucomicrobiota bacterium]